MTATYDTMTELIVDAIRGMHIVLKEIHTIKVDMEVKMFFFFNLLLLSNNIFCFASLRPTEVWILFLEWEMHQSTHVSSLVCAFVQFGLNTTRRACS